MWKIDQHQDFVKPISPYQAQGCSLQTVQPMVEASTETQVSTDQPLSQVVTAANPELLQEQRAQSLHHPSVRLQSETNSPCGNRAVLERSIQKTRKNNLISNSSTELFPT